jgi:predicted naringenin-chalcone synthase
MQKMRYYTSKISTFYKQQKDKYDSVIVTRYISFLDTYSISLEESLKEIAFVFGEEGYKYDLSDAGPPKVKEMIKSKNMNEVIDAEKTYHE